MKFNRTRPPVIALVAMTAGLFIGFLACSPYQKILKPLKGTADPDDWPAVFAIRGGCTATLIGPHAIIGAEHCEALSPQSGLNLRAVGEQRPKLVLQLDECWRDSEIDLVICSLEDKFPGVPETLTTLPEITEARNHYRVFIGGFGCKLPQRRRGPKPYRVGQATAYEDKDKKFLRLENKQVCNRDSGGPTYLLNDEIGADPKIEEIKDIEEKLRGIVAINSKLGNPNKLAIVSSARAKKKVVCEASKRVRINKTFSC